MTKEQFWDWFDNNKAALEDLISGKTKNYDTYRALSEKLSQYSAYLIPELTLNKEKRFVLIISCDGIKEGIPFAEALTQNIGEFDKWVVDKYRQPEPMEFIPFDGFTLKRKRIFLEWQKTPTQQYFLTFYVKSLYPNNKKLEMVTLLHIDHTIGEYESMTRIEGVEIKKLGLFQSTKGLKTLDDLKTELDNNPV